MAEIKYNPYAHHSKESGYQNTEVAKGFAEYVVKLLKERFGADLDRKYISIYGVDNSSTYLAAHVKMLLPNVEFISGKKAENEDNYDFTGMTVGYATLPDVLLFVDDYFCRGRAACQFAYNVQNSQNFSSECSPEIIFCFIKSQHPCMEVKKRIEDICSKYPISVNIMA